MFRLTKFYSKLSIKQIKCSFFATSFCLCNEVSILSTLAYHCSERYFRNSKLHISSTMSRACSRSATVGIQQ